MRGRPVDEVRRRVLRIAIGLALGAAAGACSSSLVDHSAGADVLHPSGCAAGEVLCGAECVPEDGLHCGSSCASCAASVPPDPNAGPACSEAHACTFACKDGWLRVGSACERATAVSGGFGHTCAVTTSGKVKCWGANEHGQLGDGTTVDSAIPVDAGLPAAAKATAIAAGYVHTCAIADGNAYCWGDNTTGALGDGTTTQRTSPVQVSGISGATEASAGGGETTGTPTTWYGHSCALVGGSIWCWGGNDSGQLGNNSFTQSATPVQVALGNLDGQATAVSNGDRHTCAVLAGGVWCWGAGTSWQLGNGGTSSQSKPVQAQNLQSGASAVAAGAAHSCAAVSGTLDCWGENSAGQAAAGASSGPVQRPTAVSLPGLAPSAAAAGNAHTCALDGATGAVTCFGANDASQLSGAPTARGSIPVPLPSGAKAITAGFSHSCALLADGGIVCWGANGRGQLGTGTASAAVETPSYVSGR